jgi:hypothetical protein
MTSGTPMERLVLHASLLTWQAGSGTMIHWRILKLLMISYSG